MLTSEIISPFPKSQFLTLILDKEEVIGPNYGQKLKLLEKPIKKREKRFLKSALEGTARDQFSQTLLQF